MELKLQRITRSLDLGEYARELSGQALHVWVNPTLEFRRKRDQILLPLLDELNSTIQEDTPERTVKANLYFESQIRPQIDAWFAELWSQHADPVTHYTAEEIKVIHEHDPKLLEWMKNMSTQMIVDFGKAEKKS